MQQQEKQIRMTGLTGAKTDLRARMLAARDAVMPEFRAAAAQALAARAGLPAFLDLLPEAGGIVAGYWPIRSEIDPRPLMLALHQLGYRLALPRIAESRLAFHAYTPGDELVKGPLGTREPAATSEVVVPGAVLTPLLAFDIRGARLGYGKSFYDRAFAGLPNARRIGLAFRMQQVAAVPREPHDAELDAIFTEA